MIKIKGDVVMNKTIKVLGVTTTLAVVFGLGTFTGATTDWKTEVINEANSRISGAGYNKKEELINSDVATEVKAALDPTIQKYEDELATMLDEYYQLKLAGITEGEEVTLLEAQMEAKKQEIYARYTQDIDALFE